MCFYENTYLRFYTFGQSLRSETPTLRGVGIFHNEVMLHRQRYFAKARLVPRRCETDTRPTVLSEVALRPL